MVNSKPAPPADLSVEIAATQRVIRETEQIGLPVHELEERAVDQLQKDEELYRAPAFDALPGLTVQQELGYLRRAVRGAFMSTARERTIADACEKVRADFAMRGGKGLTLAAKEERLIALRRQLRVLHAKRELQARAAEARGELVDRDPDAAETFLAETKALEAVVAGKEPG